MNAWCMRQMETPGLAPVTTLNWKKWASPAGGVETTETRITAAPDLQSKMVRAVFTLVFNHKKLVYKKKVFCVADYLDLSPPQQHDYLVS